MASRRNKASQDATPQANSRIREAAAEIYRVVRAVSLDEITVLDEVQVRVNGLDEARVEQYVEFLLAGGAFKDPIDLFEDGWRLILSAGWHRTEAYRRALKRFVPSKDVPALASLKAEIHPGGLEAAIEWAEEDNLAHGLELSPRDKRNIFERRFRRGHEWVRLSNRALAAKLGVHHDTIAVWRREIAQSSTGGNPPVERMSADGKLRDVSNIQAANQRRAEEQREVREREAAIADLRGGILDALADGKSKRSIELAAALGSPALEPYRQAREALKREGLIIEEVAPGMRVSYRLAPDASVNSTQIADAGASDNRYQSEPEATGWLDQQVERKTPGVALRDNTSIEYESDEAMAARLTELLLVGMQVVCDLEDVLDQIAPVPEWVLSKFDALSKLLHGYPGQDDDIWNPGLNSLLADLNTRSRREKK